MPAGPFSLWVQSSLPEVGARLVVRQLAIAFNVQLTPAQLAEGACLVTAPTLDLAQARADDALAAGASYQIVDAQGTVVGQGTGRVASAGVTLLGVPPRGAPLPARQRAGPSPSAELRRPKDPGRGFDIDAVDASSLMTLDGETSASAPRGPAASVRPSAAPTLPPPRSASLGARGASERAAPASDAAFRPPDDDAPLTLGVPRTTGPHAAQAPAAAVAQTAAPSPPPPSAPPSPPSPRSADPYDALPPLPAAPPRASRRSAQREELPSLLLFGGRLREAPRLRIIVGFLLALGLGAILPAWRASAVNTAQIEPARKELSRALAYGHLLAGQRGFRSAEEITAYIGGVKHRNAFYGVLMWLGCGGLAGALWFRFT